MGKIYKKEYIYKLYKKIYKKDFSSLKNDERGKLKLNNKQIGSFTFHQNIRGNNNRHRVYCDFPIWYSLHCHKKNFNCVLKYHSLF